MAYNMPYQVVLYFIDSGMEFESQNNVMPSANNMIENRSQVININDTEIAL